MVDEVEFFGGPFDGRIIQLSNVLDPFYYIPIDEVHKTSNFSAVESLLEEKWYHYYRLEINDLNGIKRYKYRGYKKQ